MHPSSQGDLYVSNQHKGTAWYWLGVAEVQQAFCPSCLGCKALGFVCSIVHAAAAHDQLHTLITKVKSQLSSSALQVRTHTQTPAVGLGRLWPTG